MKSILQRIREKDESEMADADHPYRKDITMEEFIEAINQSYQETRKIAGKNIPSAAEKEERENAILAALNSSSNARY